MTGEDFTRDRADRGLSQQAMADLVGVKVDVIRSLEAGRRPQPANALAVASFYNKRITEIWPVEPPKREVA